MTERAADTSDSTELELFLRLSETLLDLTDLDPGYAAECRRLVVAAAPASYGPTPGLTPLQAMLAAFAELAKDPTDLEARTVAVLYADGTLAAMARNLIVAWYVGALGSDVVAAEYYGSALIWRLLSANPPGLPGPYYGSWANPPPRVIDAPAPGLSP